MVPIRAGGGTRIKILEAFGYGRVVISTTLGAEGIAAKDGREILIADNADDFAQAAWRLVNEAGLAAALIGNGRRTVMELIRRAHASMPSKPSSWRPLRLAPGRRRWTPTPPHIESAKGRRRVRRRLTLQSVHCLAQAPGNVAHQRRQVADYAFYPEV
jgi:hypothetical protein